MTKQDMTKQDMTKQDMTKQERDSLSDALLHWRLMCSLRYDNFYNHYDAQVRAHYMVTWRDERGN